MIAKLSTVLRSIAVSIALAQCAYGPHSASNAPNDPTVPPRNVASVQRAGGAIDAIREGPLDAEEFSDASALTQVSVDASAESNPTRQRTLDERLADDEVDDERPWRAVLYSWTPPDRAAALAQSQTLLVATAQSGNAPSPFSRLLSRFRSRPGELGVAARALLEDPSLNRYRYAWTNAYGTALGFIGRSYGTALVRIELAPNALVLRLDPLDPRPIRLIDRDQHELPLRRFDELRTRIAAVYHVRRSGDVRVPFREYVVCNASAVVRWSIGTPPVREEIARERQLVAALFDALTSRAVAPLGPRQRYAEWNNATRSPSPTLAHRWARTMATAAPHYELTIANLRALAAALAQYDASTTFDYGTQG